MLRGTITKIVREESLEDRKIFGFVETFDEEMGVQGGFIPEGIIIMGNLTPDHMGHQCWVAVEHSTNKSGVYPRVIKLELIKQEMEVDVSFDVDSVSMRIDMISSRIRALEVALTPVARVKVQPYLDKIHLAVSKLYRELGID